MARILIVDDEKSIRRTLGQFLRDDGHEAIEAEDADAALQCLQEAEFDVVVTDIILPRLTGVELLRRIHATAPHVQVIMMTGEPTVETASDSLRAGAADYLFKPVNKAAILRVVNNAVRLKTLDDAKRRLETENRAYQANLEHLVDERTRQLRASEERARELAGFNQGVLDALAAHVCVLTEDGAILAVNQAWRAFAKANLPSPANADVGANYLAVCEAVTGEDAAVAREVLQGLCTVARGDLPEFSLEYSCHSPTTQRWFVLRATRFAGAGPVRIVAAHVNITERKLAEEQLRKLARAVEQSPVSVVITDRAGNIEFVNPKFTQVTGYALAEVLGKNPRVLKSGQTTADEYRKLWEAITAGKEWRGEFHNKRKDGTLYCESASISPIRAVSGEITHFIAVKEDVTAKKQMEAQFLRAQRLEGVGALASGIAHDLNNILAPVLMIAPLLRMTVQDADSRAMLDTVEGCAQRGADIIKQLLTFARGKPGARVPLPLRHMLRDFEKIIRETFPRDISPKVDLPSDLWPFLVDATQVHQALMNLCVNARDAMPDGGTLTLAANNVTVDESFASMTPGARLGPHVCLTVTDTGTGIAPENLDHIFDPFFTTKEIGQGTGLGLATVLGIVRGHEGFVRVDSRLGHGTTFALYFPASPLAPAAHIARREAQPPRGQGELILVVDDEAALCDSLRRTLENHGYRVVTTSHGGEGLAAFSLHRTTLRAVLTDMMMPVMNGPAMINRLRAIDPHLPILGMSGLPERKAVRGFEQVQLSALLEKPFTGEELLRVLHAVLQASVAAPLKPRSSASTEPSCPPPRAPAAMGGNTPRLIP
jgi:PAS domain S-box-containing protein